jgi:hypothetical protein
MPVDPTGLFDALMAGLSKVPSAIIAAALIAGPTLAWLIARFLNPPDPASAESKASEEVLWVCASCRSINDDRAASCYRCHRLRTGQPVAPIDEDEPRRTAPGVGVGVAVGPGRPVLVSDDSWIEVEVARASDAVDGDPQPVGPPVPAEPPSLIFEPVILEPQLKASSRPAPLKPPARRTRRKPQGSGEEKPKRERKTGSG